LVVAILTGVLLTATIYRKSANLGIQSRWQGKFTIPTSFLWIIVSLVGFVVYFAVVERIIKHFVHFPIPAFAARFIDNPIRRRLQPPKKVVNWIGIKEGMCVLEIGPGPGTFTIEAAKRVGQQGKFFAIDIQASIISRLDLRLLEKGIENAATKVASAYDLPFSDRTFDRVFMVAVLGEIADKNKALLEVKRVLKDDGLVAIGELLPDPDYPLRKSVIGWCDNVGLEKVGAHGGVMHYLLLFGKSESALRNTARLE